MYMDVISILKLHKYKISPRKLQAILIGWRYYIETKLRSILQSLILQWAGVSFLIASKVTIGKEAFDTKWN